MTLSRPDCKIDIERTPSGIPSESPTDMSQVYLSEIHELKQQIEFLKNRLDTLDHNSWVLAMGDCKRIETLPLKNGEQLSDCAVYTQHKYLNMPECDGYKYDSPSMNDRFHRLIHTMNQRNKVTKVYNKNQIKYMTKDEIENADVSLLDDFSYMFACDSRFESIDLSRWNMRNAINLDCMFVDSEFKHINVSNWHVEPVDKYRVLNINDMFKNCKSLITIDVTNWAIIPKFGIMASGIFKGCVACENIIGLRSMFRFVDGTRPTSFLGLFDDMTLKSYDVRDWKWIREAGKYDRIPVTVDYVCGFRSTLDADIWLPENTYMSDGQCKGKLRVYASRKTIEKLRSEWIKHDRLIPY